MENIVVKTENKEYPIYLSDSFEGLKDAVEALQYGKRKLCIITDSNVFPFYAEEVKKNLESIFSETSICCFPYGEINKTIDTITKFYDFFIQKKLDRKSVIIGLGGGVCGDMAGFAAATYLRGIKFIQVPTTLLSQVDSSVGGKVGIDYKGGKNIIGAFYQPDLVYININSLKTLPEREFNAGMAEVIKYGPISSKEFYDYISNNKVHIKALNEAVIKTMVKRCCEIKADVVTQDEKESGLREILNFGHTIGHAVESVKDFSLLHGECVSIGMVAVMYICLRRGIINADLFNSFVKLLEYFDLPVKAHDIDSKKVYNQMFFDKKVKDNKIGFVLLKDFGTPVSTTEVSEKEIIEAIKYVTR